MFDPDAQQARECKRQKLVDKVVLEVDRLILDASDGSVEKTNQMTADVAVALLISALIPVGGEPNYVPPVVAQMARAEARGMVDHNCREDSPIIRSAATGKNCREVRR